MSKKLKASIRQNKNDIMGKVCVVIKVFESKADYLVDSLIRKGFNSNDFILKKIKIKTVPSLKIMFETGEDNVEDIKTSAQLFGADAQIKK